MTNELSWTQKTWKCHDCKHHWKFGPPKNEAWAEIRKKTKLAINGRRPTAKYHPDLSRLQWRQIEEQTLAQDETGRYVHEFDSGKEDKRTFCRRVTGLAHPLGASMGEDTDWVYVEWLGTPQGEFHGQPMTIADLKRRGATI